MFNTNFTQLNSDLVYGSCLTLQDLNISGPITTDELAVMIPVGSYHLFVQRTGDYAITDIPSGWGEMILVKVKSTNFTTAWYITTTGIAYKYKYHDTDNTGSGWDKLLTNADMNKKAEANYRDATGTAQAYLQTDTDHAALLGLYNGNGRAILKLYPDNSVKLLIYINSVWQTLATWTPK